MGKIMLALSFIGWHSSSLRKGMRGHGELGNIGPLGTKNWLALIGHIAGRYVPTALWKPLAAKPSNKEHDLCNDRVSYI